MFLKEKRSLDQKGRIVAGGNKQRDDTNMRLLFPISNSIAVFITAATEAMEGQYVAIADIPIAFVQTDLIKNNEAVKISMATGENWRSYWLR